MRPDRQKQTFGAHLSIAGGLHRAIEAAVQLGCDCLQIFVKNQQQWTTGPLSEVQVRLFRAYPITPAARNVTHAQAKWSKAT